MNWTRNTGGRWRVHRAEKCANQKGTTEKGGTSKAQENVSESRVDGVPVTSFHCIDCFSTWTSATSESENSMSDSEEETRRPPPKRKQPVKRKNQKSQYSSESDSDDENKR